MLFRKFLIWVKDKQRSDPKNLYFYCVAGFLAFAIASVVVDAYIPFENYWMFLRTFIMAPMGIIAFIGIYAFSLEMSEKKEFEYRQEGSNWVPFRLRYSPKWRRNVSLIIGALLVVVMYSSEYFVGYTIMSSAVLTIVIVLLAFCRMTRTENKRAELKVPDPRDAMFEERMKQYQRQKEKLKREQDTSDEEDAIYSDDDERVVQSTEARREKNKNDD